MRGPPYTSVLYGEYGAVTLKMLIDKESSPWWTRCLTDTRLFFAIKLLSLDFFWFYTANKTQWIVFSHIIVAFSSSLLQSFVHFSFEPNGFVYGSLCCGAAMMMSVQWKTPSIIVWNDFEVKWMVEESKTAPQHHKPAWSSTDRDPFLRNLPPIM